MKTRTNFVNLNIFVKSEEIPYIRGVASNSRRHTQETARKGRLIVARGEEFNEKGMVMQGIEPCNSRC